MSRNFRGFSVQTPGLRQAAISAPLALSLFVLAGFRYLFRLPVELSANWVFRVTEPGRDFLLQEGTDQRYGARHLKRAIERHVVYPMANLLATEQVHLGDLICIDWNKEQERLTFVREGENLALPARKPEPAPAAKVVSARNGKSADAPNAAPSPEPSPRLAR